MRGTFVRSGALHALSGSLWRSVFALRRGADGVAVPEGFTSRVVARSGERTGGVTWHASPGDGACFPEDEGWIYVSNSGVALLGGVTALRFASDGGLRDAYRILSGTDLNRSGTATPWHTWLSCEQTAVGQVFECDPYGTRAPMPRLGMGLFRHHGIVGDPDREVFYLTEAEPDGCLYRFRPDDWGDLTTGVLEVMVGEPGAEEVDWARVPSPAAPARPLRDQVKGARRFDRGEACHYSGGVCHIVTRGDGRVWAYDTRHERVRVAAGPGESTGRPGGQEGLFLAGDPGVTEITVVVPGGAAEPFLRVDGPAGGMEDARISGLAFSPDGTRLYFSCRRPTSPRVPVRRGGAGPVEAGVTYEVAGPFRERLRAATGIDDAAGETADETAAQAAAQTAGGAAG
ncbi:alkaline phosphatase PhoX [Microbispora oryzae]|uniref:alkaline phosphatase PhoX n=1 Tax=Microbispora oryzae TaxID=2806554 RepID=UPI001E61EE33|nr:alkaline phosphatase PhoX [Microbispora oryzae]